MGQLVRRHEDLGAIVEALRSQKKTVVFAPGVFDLLHAGVIRALRDAKSRGHFLILGLYTDASVKSKLESGRPLASEKDRIEIVSALEPVDYVTVVDAGARDSVVEAIRPDILATGIDTSLTLTIDKKAIAATDGRAVAIRRGAGFAVFVKKVQGLSGSQPRRKTTKSAGAKKKSGRASTTTRKATQKKAAKEAKTSRSASARSSRKKRQGSSSGAATRTTKSRRASARRTKSARKAELVGAS